MNERLNVVFRRAEAGIVVGALISLIDAPAEISALGDDVEFFDGELPDIAGIQLTDAAPVKRPAIGISHSQCPDLIGSLDADKRIIGGNRIGRETDRFFGARSDPLLP